MEEIELKDVVEPDLMHRILTAIYGSADVVTPGKSQTATKTIIFDKFENLLLKQGRQYFETIKMYSRFSIHSLVSHKLGSPNEQTETIDKAQVLVFTLVMGEKCYMRQFYHETK